MTPDTSHTAATQLLYRVLRDKPGEAWSVIDLAAATGLHISGIRACLRRLEKAGSIKCVPPQPQKWLAL